VWTPTPTVDYLPSRDSHFLNGDQANQGEIVGMGAVPSSVSKLFPGASTKPDASTRFLMYSYSVSRRDNGLPEPYGCADTVTHSILTNAQLLDMQIKNAFKVQPAGAEVDIYLIGHSLGGAVALAYLDFLQQKLGVALPPNAHLKAVITLDAPIGGVAPGIFDSFTAFGNGILRWRCPELNDQTPFTSPSDLLEVFNSTSVTSPPAPEKTVPRGAQASFLALHRGTPPWILFVPSNGDLTEAAQTDLGISFLLVGNINDFLWNPAACVPGLPSFLDTQFLEDDGDGKVLYGREFVGGSDTCPTLDIERTVLYNHSVVFNNQNVQQGIKNFLNPLVSRAVGRTPNPLVINRYQTLP
jgi:pimeloyl-ACP methyl ester carboxylesterase